VRSVRNARRNLAFGRAIGSQFVSNEGLFRAWVVGSSLFLGFTLYENGRAAFSPPKLIAEKILFEDITFTEEGTGLWVVKHGDFDAEYEVPKSIFTTTVASLLSSCPATRSQSKAPPDGLFVRPWCSISKLQT
jgi:hypothetical protein